MRPDPITRFVRGSLADLAPDGVPVLRQAVTRALSATLGGSRPVPRDDDRDGAAGDPGLTGPGSASWQVLSDVAGLPAGVRALQLQALHPLAVAGVSDHSGFRADQFGRLHRTGQWVAAMTFGSVPQALAVTRAVRAQHRRVRGTAPDGRPYAADDPELLSWVSITFTDSLLAMDQAFAAHPVDAATADRFVLEQSRVSALLDPRVDLQAVAADPEALRAWDIELPLLEEGWLPTSVGEMTAVLDRHRPSLHVGEQGREIIEFLRDPGLLPAARPAYELLRAASLATLPLDLRELLGAGWLRPPLTTALVRQAGVLLTGLRLSLGTTSPARRAAEERVLAS